jgi:hypothetical protein
VFGSEFVSGCYQPGCGEIGQHCDVAHFPNRDGKYTTPWDRKPIG